MHEAQARAAQAGPLAQARASKDVIAEQTSLAEREAELTEKRLESQVRRPADAEAYKQRTLAEAARDSTKLNTEAEAYKQRSMAEAARDTTKLNTEAEADRRATLAATDANAQRVSAHAAADAAHAQADAAAYSERTTAAADAEVINARASALAGENQGLIAANKIVEMLPELVQAAAQGIVGSHLAVLNGTEGVNDVTANLAAQGLAIYSSLRSSLTQNPFGGPAPAEDAARTNGAAISKNR